MWLGLLMNWVRRDIVPDTSEEALDRDAKNALEFERYMLGGNSEDSN